MVKLRKRLISKKYKNFTTALFLSLEILVHDLVYSRGKKSIELFSVSISLKKSVMSEIRNVGFTDKLFFLVPLLLNKIFRYMQHAIFIRISY